MLCYSGVRLEQSWSMPCQESCSSILTPVASSHLMTLYYSVVKCRNAGGKTSFTDLRSNKYMASFGMTLTLKCDTQDGRSNEHTRLKLVKPASIRKLLISWVYSITVRHGESAISCSVRIR